MLYRYEKKDENMKSLSHKVKLIPRKKNYYNVSLLCHISRPRVCTFFDTTWELNLHSSCLLIILHFTRHTRQYLMCVEGENIASDHFLNTYRSFLLLLLLNLHIFIILILVPGHTAKKRRDFCFIYDNNVILG